ncbi:helix-turn-helix domain-containing protein [Crocinitomix catalasitica]|uniref:helix-turn-helix domain-containing protein n=1 Tax=Crocinitomix catalasitica TaxID=184607 RepID=UPI0005629C62|nr:AraC family transcriptional regulator [Crocinitomix catalasitica]
MENKQQNQLIPRLKKVEPDFGSSIRYSRFTERNPDAKAFWHYHPEVELVYIEKGYGNRYVGNHISSFDDGDLILMGPNVPHFGYEFGLQGINEEIVVQFKEELFKNAAHPVPEFEAIIDLITKARSGISFFGETKKTIGAELLLMEDKNPLERLSKLIDVLSLLAQSEEYQVLNADGVTLVIQNQSDDRINKVYQYVKDNYESEITLVEISKIAIMTVPSFCRYFKKYTKQTFTQFVNEFRIRQAIRLIASGNKSISEISFDVGFNNFSHFNKQFKKVTGKSPSKYKSSMYQILK